jgi:hypothetical protein
MTSRIKALLFVSFLSAPTLAQAQDEESAPATEEAAATEDSKPEAVAPSEASSKSSGGLLGAFRVGPTVSLAFPYLLNGSIDAKWNNLIGLSVSGGKMKRDIQDETSLEVFNWDVRARWFPWSGSFFLGAAFGNMGIVGKKSKDLNIKNNDVTLKIPTTVRMEVKTTYLTPHLGWMATWDAGFTLGFEVGYHMPLSSKAEMQTGFSDVSTEAEEELKQSDEYKKAKKDVEDKTEAYGKKAVPYINLLRIGWLF